MECSYEIKVERRLSRDARLRFDPQQHPSVVSAADLATRESHGGLT
jgi:hypothetical protein